MLLPEAVRLRLEAAALLILRLALGSVFLMHGAQKLFGAFSGGGLAGAMAAAAGAGFQPSGL